MLARSEQGSRAAGSRERSRPAEVAGFYSNINPVGPRPHGAGQGMLTPLPGAVAEEQVKVSGTLLSLIQLCLSELRSDIARLFESGWAEPERNRTCELAKVLDQACERQGLRRLAVMARSVAMLAGLAREEAIPLYPELKKKFKELLLLAEKCLLKSSDSLACA